MEERCYDKAAYLDTGLVNVANFNKVCLIKVADSTGKEAEVKNKEIRHKKGLKS